MFFFKRLVLHKSNLSTNVDLNLFRTFVTVYKERNLSSAALKLGLSKSAVSLKMKTLKEHIGGEIFFKTAYGFEPTELAHSLYNKVEPFVSDIDNDMMSYNDVFRPELITKPIIIDIGHHFIDYISLELFNRIEMQCPNSYLISNYFTSLSLDGIFKGDIDIGVQFDVFGSKKDIINYQIGSLDTTLLVHKEHPYKKDTAKLQDILKYPFALYELGINTLGANGKFINELERRNISHNIGFKSSSQKSIVNVLSRTDFIFPTCIVDKNFCSSNDLRKIDVVDFKEFSSLPVSCYFNKSYRHSPKNKWLMDLIRVSLGLT
ncbi:LysR family transcriptional regulator [Vibrio breoganii]